MSTGRSYAQLSAEQRRSLLRRAVVWPTGTAVVLVVAYFVLPLRRVDDVRTWVLLVAVLVVVVVVAAWQVYRITRDRYPVVQAAEALAAVVPTYLVGFAMVYHLMSEASPTSFAEPLSRMAALYFTVTVASTVGFGDITADTDAARAVVTVQMLANLVLLGLGGRLVLLAVRAGRSRSAAGDDPPS
ncbi:potassium channel family protein [Rhodococcus sp. X156]|uniref:potassium channel family protein n=1 Tax=Rhodococcus sp. X156 TaxID=2499145 RepID=UPI000FD9D19C|nr:potassium channel family protein [Rhodococcus sp. X156]